MATNYNITPFNAVVNYKKFDVIYESAGVYRYHYATQDTVGYGPTAVFNYAVASYSREDDAATLYYTYTGAGPRFSIGSIVRVTGMNNTSFNYTGMVIDAGSGWVKYLNAGWPESATASVGAINCTNPAWTTGFYFTPSYTTAMETIQRTISAQFGDGYSQRQRNGLNNNVQTWTLSFNDRSDLEAKAILNYVESHDAASALRILIPINKFNNNPSLKYVLSSPKLSTNSWNLNNVSVTATQVFDI